MSRLIEKNIDALLCDKMQYEKKNEVRLKVNQKAVDELFPEKEEFI